MSFELPTPDPCATRLTASFTIFFRSVAEEGGYLCHRCNATETSHFTRIGHAFAVATQHLLLCRSAVKDRPVEGCAIIDGQKHGVSLRDGVMVVAMGAVFGGSGAVRALA